MSGSNLFTGTLDILVLRSVESEPLHGYAIGRTLRDGSEGVLAVEEGALYPALHRLERRGLLESRWGKTETGRRAKFYLATDLGLAHLKTEHLRWSRYADAVSGILGTAES